MRNPMPVTTQKLRTPIMILTRTRLLRAMAHQRIKETKTSQVTVASSPLSLTLSKKGKVAPCLSR